MGLVKDKKDKSKQNPETHANDGIAIASTYFIKYQLFNTVNTHGHTWEGVCLVTPAPFSIITRPKLFRRKLYQENYSKGGILKRVGGTITPFEFRSGDLVQTTRKGQVVRGWVGGYSEANKVISIYDHNWKRLGQFSPNKTQLIKRSTKLCVAY